MKPSCSSAPTRDFLDLLHQPAGELRAILDAAKAMKAARVKGERPASLPLAGKTLAMIFDAPSTRTRVSFDMAMRELGGETIMLTGDEMQLGRGESIGDTARVLSRYVDAIMIRILSHADMAELARHAAVPVINGLTKQSHPCQVMADVFTFEEHRGPIRGRKIAWSGDYNNVLSSWIDASQRFDFLLDIACPKPLQPPPQRIDAARAGGANVILREDPHAAVAGAAAVLSDCWVSMGDESEAIRRHNLLAPYQVNAELMSGAAADAIFMHCLPAHRGEEVTDEVIDGPQSVVFDEAENRLHAQKAVLAWCLGALNR
jgi:ornithine carbamoyltransferase